MVNGRVSRRARRESRAGSAEGGESALPMSDSDRSDGGSPVATSHVAYFLVPLPDALALPDKYTFSTGVGDWLEGPEGEEIQPASVAVSFCFHQLSIEGQLSATIGELFDLAGVVLPLETDRGATGLDLTAMVARPRESLTVVEMAVPVDLEDETDDAASRVSDAFDLGLSCLRQFQHAYHIVRRDPIRISARESLPPIIPHAVRALYDDHGNSRPFKVELSMFLTNMNIRGEVSEWGESDGHVLQTAIDHQYERGAFHLFLEFTREAQVALERDGSYRAAVVFAATACEVLLDELLMHMLWEEGVRPEIAAAEFNSWLTSRVKSKYHPRLGGAWGLGDKGPVSNWSTHVAGLRNRVVHVGYDPSRDETSMALDAAESLSVYLGDLLAEKVPVYPRTAIVLPGRHGLERRGKWTAELELLTRSKDEVPWIVTYARWRLALQRARTNNSLGVEPSADGAWICVCVRKGGAQTWVVHDRQSGHAAVLKDGEVVGVSGAARQALAEFSEAQAGRNMADASSVRVIGAGLAPGVEPNWVPEYLLIPEANVMVDRTDLSWFDHGRSSGDPGQV
jgi:hypothetical protein